MKNTYQSILPGLWRPWYWVVLLLALPLHGNAQFLETFGTTITSRETIASAQAAGKFDQNKPGSKLLTYSGTAVGATTMPGTNATPAPSIFFGPTAGPVDNSEYTLRIAGINTANLTDIGLDFSLYSATAGSAQNIFIVEYRIGDTGGFTALSYNANSIVAGNWATKSVATTIPSATNLTLQFRKAGNVNSREFRIDNVNLTGTVIPNNLSATPNPVAFGTVSPPGATTTQTFTFNGAGLAGDVTLTSQSSNVLIRRAGTTNAFSSSLLLTRNGSNDLDATTIETQLNGPLAPNSAFTGIIKATVANSPTTYDVQVTATVAPTSATPQITTSTDNIDFGAVASNGSVSTTTLQVGATNIGANAPLTITPSSANILIRQGNGTFSSGAIRLTADANGTVALTAIEVKLGGGPPSLATGPYNGALNITSNSVSKTVTVTANGTGRQSDITLFGNTTLNFATPKNSASAYQTYTVQGAYLLQDLTITAPADFQIGAGPSYFSGHRHVGQLAGFAAYQLGWRRGLNCHLRSLHARLMAARPQIRATQSSTSAHQRPTRKSP